MNTDNVLRDHFVSTKDVEIILHIQIGATDFGDIRVDIPAGTELTPTTLLGKFKEEVAVVCRTIAANV